MSEHEKACSLIGQFINAWSLAEYDISWAIRKICGLDFAYGAIITGNLGLGAKVNVLRSFFAEPSKGRMTEDWREEADKTCSKILELIIDRNIAAHTYFEATDKGDILFVRLFVKKDLRRIKSFGRPQRSPKSATSFTTFRMLYLDWQKSLQFRPLAY